jgi:hypothetical protein
MILHYDGISWKVMNTGTTPYIFTRIRGSSSSDVFVAGAGGVIQHFDGLTWTTVSEGTTNVYQGIWGSSSSDVFAVGTFHAILHYDGSGWKMDNGTPFTTVSKSDGTTMISGVSGINLNAVWGSSPTDIFTVFNSENILHFNGNDGRP